MRLIFLKRICILPKILTLTQKGITVSLIFLHILGIIYIVVIVLGGPMNLEHGATLHSKPSMPFNPSQNSNSQVAAHQASSHGFQGVKNNLQSGSFFSPNTAGVPSFAQSQQPPLTYNPLQTQPAQLGKYQQGQQHYIQAQSHFNAGDHYQPSLKPTSNTAFPSSMFENGANTAAAAAISILSQQVLGQAHPLSQFQNATSHTQAAQKMLNGWLDWPVSHLKPYFQVTTQFVYKRIVILVFPFAFKNWQRIQAQEGSILVMTGAVSVLSASNTSYGQHPYQEGLPYDPNKSQFYPQTGPMLIDEQPTTVPVLFALPRDDSNAPDLYIPAMAFVTYVLLAGLIYGLDGKFHPEILGVTASWAFFLTIFECAIMKLGCYLSNIGPEVPLLDIFAYIGYQYVGLVGTLFLGLLVNSPLFSAGKFISNDPFASSFSSLWWKSPNILIYIGWLYIGIAYATFLLRSLKHALLPDTPGFHSPIRRKRLNFLLLMVAIQFILSSFLIVIPSRSEVLISKMPVL